MVGKVCMVTGGTSGIGLVTARDLAARGATVFIVGRDAARGSQAVDAIRSATGEQAVEWLGADLSSQADVRSLAREFLTRHHRLHVLVNNAGAMYALRRESVDGIEMTLALNHLGPFLLTTLLLDALKAARSHGLGSYPRSELASTFYTLAMPWAHPGFLQYARTKLEGAATPIHVATSTDGELMSGRYFMKCAPAPCSDAARDTVAATRLWELSASYTRRNLVKP